ncbi:hypothetical protein GGF42_007672, partial [Coemansia sp. RSA 2424]
MLAVASVVGGANSDIIALTHLAQCAKTALLAPESGSLLATMLSILIHAAVAFRVSTPLARQTVIEYVYGSFQVDTFRFIKEAEDGTLSNSDSAFASSSGKFSNNSQNFYVDTTQRLFLVRAVLRAYTREIAIILLGVVACNYLLHYQQLLFAQILGTFVADYNGTGAQTAKLIGLCSLSEIFSIYIVINKLGWGSVLPIVVAAIYAALQAKLDMYVMELRNAAKTAFPPKFQQVYTNICEHMKTIKLYAWESVFLHDKGFSKDNYVTPPLVWLAQFAMLAINSSLSEIAASMAIISQLRPDSSLSYVDVTIILSSMSSLVSFTRSLGSISMELNFIAETEAVFKRIVDYQQADYIIRKTPTKDIAVKMSDCEFSWGKEKFSLHSTALEIKQG